MKKYFYLFGITLFFDGETLPNQIVTQPVEGVAEGEIQFLEPAAGR